MHDKQKDDHDRSQLVICFTPDRGSLSSSIHYYNDDDLRRRERGKTSVVIERLAADTVALNKRSFLILYKCL